MVRQAVCDARYQGYLADIGKASKFSIGLIIGQVSSKSNPVSLNICHELICLSKYSSSRI